MRNLRIVLIQEKVSYKLDSLASDTIKKDASKEKRATYKIWKDDSMTVKYIIRSSMNNELQRQHEDMNVPYILLNLKELYGEQS